MRTNIILKLIFCFCLTTLPLYSQGISFNLLYETVYMWGNPCIRETREGGYVIAATGDNGSLNAYLLKIDSLGNEIWSKHFLRDSMFCYGFSVDQASDGGYIILGSTYDSLTSVYLIKTDSIGDTLWTSTIPVNINSRGNIISETEDHGFIIAGREQQQGGFCGLLIKTDSVGSMLWKKNICLSYDFEISNMWLLPEGGVRVYGKVANGYVILAQVTSEGDTIWTHIFGNGSPLNDCLVSSTSDSGFIGIRGGNYEIELVKVDSTFEVQWTKTYDMLYVPFFQSIFQTRDGGYFMMGSSAGPFAMKTNASGDSLWTTNNLSRYFGFSYTTIQTRDGGYIMSGNYHFDFHDPTFYLSVSKITEAGVLGVDEHLTETPKQINLYQNYPNPFNPTTDIRFTLASAQHVSITIYTILGKEVETILDKNMYAGDHTVIWDAKDKPAGVYMYRLVAGTTMETKKLLLIK